MILKENDEPFLLNNIFFAAIMYFTVVFIEKKNVLLTEKMFTFNRITHRSVKNRGCYLKF